MLSETNDISASWKVLKYIPELNLETTPQLCAAAPRFIRTDMAKTYRPMAADPRSFDELLSRLGAHEPLTALIWLAGHGCDAEAEISAAEDLIGAYKSSFDRDVMLAALTKLHRKP